MSPKGNLFGTFNQNARSHGKQRYPNQGGGQGLILAVTIVVVFVLGFVADAYKSQHHQIGCEIGQGMHGISHHGGTVTEQASYKLEQHQHHVDCTAQERYLINFFFSFHDGLFPEIL